MEKIFVTSVLLIISSVTNAEDKYPDNPILRPLTLTDGTVLIGGALSVIEERDNTSGAISLYAAYGLTDNLTINLGGLNYRFLARENNGLGLELTISAGLRGFKKSRTYGDAVVYGADLNGKYVFNRNISMNFSLGYVKWDEEKLVDKYEYLYSLGFQTNLTKGWSTSVNYTYHDLMYFAQNDVHTISAGVNYLYSKNTDVGFFIGYSNFDTLKNGYDFDNSFERTAGLYASYRF